MTDRPSSIDLEPDDHHARHVGWTTDERRQVFVTSGFHGETVYVMRYVFDEGGRMLNATIETLPRDGGPGTPAMTARMEALFGELGPIRRQRIRFQPFRIALDGVVFGLVERPPEEEGGDWAVDALPGYTMAWFPPWNSGLYDT
jgi:hypothetical protein